MPTNNKLNKLIAEKSPYLLQHAHNPVDWYPWGKEAFEKAKRENNPVLVSIGHPTTCHWWSGIIKSCGTPLKDNRSHFKR
ncbi:DUF255 domain-containing protein [Bacillus subtilis]|uniref:DUF255 domain-containing protein n=1 Tax=Bacillus subtilis TaxID=1423 RepID=UPI0029536C13|nr:DUF255 domain-containing protein [Bacillus subtilis]MEC2196797.1 DUF255 domain-containing protein [Bacillus subtilis]WOO47703.1 DUF255 domain-containing protein [Bacillus subtilis]